MNKKIYYWLLSFLSLPPFLSLNAQDNNSISIRDYKMAEYRLIYNTDPLVDYQYVRPNWFSSDLFWYKNLRPDGYEFILVNPGKNSRLPAFDHVKLAEVLSSKTGQSFSSYRLPLQSLNFSEKGNEVYFKVSGNNYSYTPATNQLNQDSSQHSKSGATETMSSGRRARRGNDQNEVRSPDGKKSAFIRDYNLWVRDLSTRKEIPLTTDGIKDFGYSTDNAGWKSSDLAILQWSPDSKKIATFKQDQRKVSDMYLV